MKRRPDPCVRCNEVSNGALLCLACAMAAPKTVHPRWNDHEYLQATRFEVAVQDARGVVVEGEVAA